LNVGLDGVMILSHDDETIIALCSPHGSGALALLRISGKNALSIASKISTLASRVSILDVPSHTVHFGHVINNENERIDQVMFIVMHAPRTFTGQDTVEITSHNNPFIIESIIECAINAGARLSQEGEFSKRAVLNNKIDLVQAEAINELIHANTRMALKQSLAQLEGSFSSWIVGIEKELLKALAFSEASFEFLDEEMEFGSTIKQTIVGVLQTIATIKKAFDTQQQIRQGVRIALIGSVNAGKSSLFNALLNKQRAIVTNIAGTTRDVIEAGLYKNNSYWTLIDTAGLRTTDDCIEQEGIARSYNEAASADIIVLVVDATRSLTEQEHAIYENILAKHAHKIIVVHNKADMPQQVQNVLLSQKEAIAVSSTTRHNIDVLEKSIENKVAQLFEHADSPFLLNTRQSALILELENTLLRILPMLAQPIQYELISYHLNDALAHLSQCTGKTISEQGMDAVFREFCVGK
jgi:tRNA modification GTPase